MGLREEQNYFGLTDFNREFFEAGVAVFFEHGSNAAECFWLY